MAYTIFLAIHNIMRWAALLAGLFAAIRLCQGWQTKRTWEKADRIAKSIFVIVMDIQFTIGIILYTVLSPVTRAAFANMGAAMKDKELRFVAVEHIFLMVAATALVHIGALKIKKATSDEAMFKFGTIFFTIALGLMIAGIPWAKRMLPL